jgi:hypothetical protein
VEGTGCISPTSTDELPTYSTGPVPFIQSFYKKDDGSISRMNKFFFDQTVYNDKTTAAESSKGRFDQVVFVGFIGTYDRSIQVTNANPELYTKVAAILSYRPFPYTGDPSETFQMLLKFNFNLDKNS